MQNQFSIVQGAYANIVQNNQNVVVVIANKIVVHEESLKKAPTDVAPTLQERWGNIEQWLQSAAAVELCDLYNSAETGQAHILSEEEFQEIQHQYPEE